MCCRDDLTLIVNATGTYKSKHLNELECYKSKPFLLSAPSSHENKPTFTSLPARLVNKSNLSTNIIKRQNSRTSIMDSASGTGCTCQFCVVCRMCKEIKWVSLVHPSKSHCCVLSDTHLAVQQPSQLEVNIDVAEVRAETSLVSSISILNDENVAQVSTADD